MYLLYPGIKATGNLKRNLKDESRKEYENEYQ
jgi:hypothetical protein